MTQDSAILFWPPHVRAGSLLPPAGRSLAVRGESPERNDLEIPLLAKPDEEMPESLVLPVLDCVWIGREFVSDGLVNLPLAFFGDGLYFDTATPFARRGDEEVTAHLFRPSQFVSHLV